MVNTIEKVLTKYPREDARPRIEHCALINEELLKRIKSWELSLLVIRA